MAKAEAAMRLRRPLLSILLLGTGLALAGCGSFDLEDIWSSKKPLPGERRDVFPQGVPGVQQGVPPDLVQGYQPPPEEPPAAAEPEKPKPKPARAAPRPANTAARQQQPRPQPQQQQQQQAQEPPPRAASQSPAPWPDTPSRTASQPQQPASSPWPDPPRPAR
jgi:hypothetical protein